MEDGALKSLMIGRLGAAIMTVVSGLLLFLGVDVAPADVQAATEVGTKIIDSGFAFGSLITGAIALGQTLYSRYKTR